MGTRGRASAASLSVVSNVVAIPRPGAPRELSDEQAAEWRAIVDRMPADWFGRETHGLLIQYCRHFVAARRVAQLIERMELDDGFEVSEYKTLLTMQEMESRAMSSLATRMRLTQQTTYHPEKSKGKVLAVKPWEE